MNARSITGSLVTVLLFLGAQRAAAHQDPPGCGTIGFNFGMAMFRADGVTPISGNQTVSLCETMQYQFSIQYRTGTADCGFQGGSMILQTPDGVFHDTAPPGGVPLMSPFDGVTSVDGTKVSYTVRAQDIMGGKLLAAAYYGCGCPGADFPPGCQDPTEHTGPGDADTLGFPTGSTGIPRGVTPCPGSTQCLTSLCDPNLQGTGADAGRMGLCTTTPVPDSTACSADNAGNPVTAIPGSCKTPGCEAGECVQAHINVTDSTPCTDTDDNACTTAGCEAGSCGQTHVSTTCTNPTCQQCDASTGQCGRITPTPRQCVGHRHHPRHRRRGEPSIADDSAPPRPACWVRVVPSRALSERSGQVAGSAFCPILLSG